MIVEYREAPIHNKRFIDHTGKRYGKLIILHYLGYANGNVKEPVWLCECDCGNMKEARFCNLQAGTVRTCGLCPKPVGKQHPEWEGVGDISKSIWHQYRLGAAARNIDFNVSLEELWELFEKQNRKCALTGWELYFPPSLKQNKNRTASLDRIDSNGIYEITNLQWVHRDVNKLKKNMDNEKFIKICIAIAKNNRSKY